MAGKYDFQFLKLVDPLDRALRGQSGVKRCRMDFAIAGKSGSYTKYKELGDLIFLAHNPKVAGSNHAHATSLFNGLGDFA